MFHFSNTVDDYQKAMNKLAGRLMWLMLGSLGISEEDVKWASPKHGFQGGSAALQLNSYPTCPDPDRAMGLAAHTDSTILTILHQSNTSGLQVLREGRSRWTTVPPHPGALVVHVGDLMHILSNGSYPSALHRAVVNRTRHRLSVAYLYGPHRASKSARFRNWLTIFIPLCIGRLRGVSIWVLRPSISTRPLRPYGYVLLELDLLILMIIIV